LGRVQGTNGERRRENLKIHKFENLERINEKKSRLLSKSFRGQYPERVKPE